MIYRKIKSSIWDFCIDDAGQGITEYGAVLAFVALLVVMLGAAGFVGPNQGVRYQVWTAFGRITAWLNLMSDLPHH